MSFGPLEIAVLIAVVLLFFGPKRLPGLGKSIGEAIRGFKKGVSEDEIDVTNSATNDQIKEPKEDPLTQKNKETEKENS